MSGPLSPTGVLLPSVAYKPPKAQSIKRNVYSNMNRPRSIALCPPAFQLPPPPPQHNDDDSDIEDDFPTPRANLPQHRIVSPPTSAALIPPQNPYRTSSVYSSNDQDEDDELYTVSDTDSEIVPIRISNSVKRMVTHEQPPALILSTISDKGKGRVAQRTMSPLTTIPQTTLSPAALARLQKQNLRVPSNNSAPSLDGSLTSEELASMSPTTPDLRSGDGFDGEWEMPVQLHPEAMETLHHIATDSVPVSIDAVVESAPVEVHEMKDRGLHISIVTAVPLQQPAEDDADFEPISAISIPSPGGFFSSLAPSIQSVWNVSAPAEPRAPSTTIAENFYNLPWGPRTSSITERIVEIRDTDTDGPPTARRLVMSPRNVADVEEQQRRHEYDENYDRKLYEEASSKLNRTSLWLSQLEAYNPGVGQVANAKLDTIVEQPPQTPRRLSTPPSEISSPESKKSVRFAGTPARSETGSVPSRPSVTSSPLIYNAFQHLFSPNTSARDAYTHRQHRVEAVQMQRLYSTPAHIAQLESSYPSAGADDSDRNDFSHLPAPPADADDEARGVAVMAASRERTALQAVSLAVWTLEAQRLLASDSLLPRAARIALRVATKNGNKAKVLDLGGAPTADWAWAVALTHRDVTVYTATVADDEHHEEAPWKAHRGPSNHRVVGVSNAWTLPFADGTFDVVSARTLHSMLRTTSAAGKPGTDEYDATLTEIKRVLAPGGVFSFELFDAAVTELDSQTGSSGSSSAALAARSAEFASTLISQGYDPCASATFITRLVEAGFGRTERAWISLPLDGAAGDSGSDGEGAGMQAVTGLVGSVAWEKWMLKVQREAGRSEERLLDGVGRALEGARRDPAAALGWTMLVGACRKAGNRAQTY